MHTKERKEQLIKALLESTVDYSKDTGLLTYKAGVRGKRAGALAGALNEYGYRRILKDGVQIRASHIAWYSVYGSLPDECIAFKEGRDDVRIDNLYLCERSLVSQKKRQPAQHSRTQILGVDEVNGRFRARIRHGAKRYEARFDSAQEASSAYMTAKQVLHRKSVQPIA